MPVVFMGGTVVLSVLVVLLTRGSFERLSQITLRAVWLLVTAAAVQIVVEIVELPHDRLDDLGLALLLGTYVPILVFCGVNRRVGGITIVMVGVALNMVVITVNQGMPTKDTVVERNGREVRVPIERTVKHRPQDDDDVLAFLGDVLTAPGAPNQQFSIGDVVIGLGVAEVCFEASRRPRRRGRYLESAASAGSVQAAGSSNPARSSTTSNADNTRAS